MDINLSIDNTTVKGLVTLIRDEVSVANRQGRYAAYVGEFSVTKDTVKDHAAALAALVFPADEPVQKKDGKRTRFGNAVQAAANGLRRALDPEQSNTDWLRLVKQAAENAHNKGEFSVEAIMAAVVETLAATDETAA